MTTRIGGACWPVAATVSCLSQLSKSAAAVEETDDGVG